MATLVEYPLSGNPSSSEGAPQVYLQYLTLGATPQQLYYTKYILNIVGELTLSTGNVREWTIPRGLLHSPGMSEPVGITRDGAGLIWIACESSNRLMSLDTVAGRYTAYFGGPAGNEFIRSPRHLQFDGSGALWFTGTSNTTAASIGRFDVKQKTVTTWTLPADMWSPEGLAVEAAGNRVWCSPIQTNAWTQGVPFPRVGALLGCLDTHLGEVKMWRLAQPQTFRPVCAGVALDQWKSPANVWVTYDDSGGSSSRVYRYDIVTGVLNEYVPAQVTAPRRIVAVGTIAWVTDWANQISMVSAHVNCGQVPVASSVVKITPQTHSVNSKTGSSEPQKWSSVPVRHTISPQRSRCYMDFPIPGQNSRPNGIVFTAAPNNKPFIYFTECGLGQIGVLQP